MLLIKIISFDKEDYNNIKRVYNNINKSYNNIV